MSCVMGLNIAGCHASPMELFKERSAVAIQSKDDPKGWQGDTSSMENCDQVAHGRP